MGRGTNEVRSPSDLDALARKRIVEKQSGQDDVTKVKADKAGVKAEKAKKKKEYEEKVNLPDYMSRVTVSVLIFIMASTMKADWLLVYANYKRSTGDFADDVIASNSTSDEDLAWNEAVKAWARLRLHNLYPDFVVPAFAVSYLFFFGVGGFLHYYYYYLQRKNPETWKCQPNHWLSAELERHEILVGAFSLTISSAISSVLSCYVMNGGYTTFYYDISDYGWAWFILQWPVVFVGQDYLTYWFHRIYHMPFLYKHFHKLHHTYKQPTAFSVTAIHPVEMISIQCIYVAPMFLFPVHWVPYTVILMYTYYHGIIDHSGINFKKAWWQPWQPDCIFHDNHHQYFHVNFGFNITLWDKLHGTLRQKDRLYTEDTFWGAGKKLTEATASEIEADLKERADENPLAYEGNKYGYELTEEDLKGIKN